MEEAGAEFLMGDQFGKHSALVQAVATYRGALPLAPRLERPIDWAVTQRCLGNALWRLGDRESGTGRLEEAVAAIRDALMEYTRERAPLEWALTQVGLGNA